MDLYACLEAKFGYREFRPGQKEVIESVLQKEDVIAMLPTGMGKSLCYQLPGYMLDGPVLIISPLLSLMQDQVDQLKKLGEKRVVGFNSFLPHNEKQYALRYLTQYRFIFISPEMLAQPNLQERFKEVKFSLIVVDEAHCISQWGFDFRPDYLRIKTFIQSIDATPKLALTATATEEVLNDIEEYLVMQKTKKYIYSVDRPNIKMATIQCENKVEKKNWIVNHLCETEGPGIVYMQSRNRANELANELLQLGIRVAAYHGGLENVDRQFIQQQFIHGTLDWIIATNAFGMGVHKQNIRQVIHETMPSTIANYMQEIGRAGRDGEQSIAITLHAPGDEGVALFLANEELPTDEQVDAFISMPLANYSDAQYMLEYRITETMRRVMQYWLSIETPEQLKLRLKQLRLIKQQQVVEMQRLLEGDRCIREALISYFGQSLTEKVEDCCSNCGLNYLNHVQERKFKQANNALEHWQHRLQTLLT